MQICIEGPLSYREHEVMVEHQTLQTAHHKFLSLNIFWREAAVATVVISDP